MASAQSQVRTLQISRRSPEHCWPRERWCNYMMRPNRVPNLRKHSTNCFATNSVVPRSENVRAWFAKQIEARQAGLSNYCFPCSTVALHRLTNRLFQPFRQSLRNESGGDNRARSFQRPVQRRGKGAFSGLSKAISENSQSFCARNQRRQYHSWRNWKDSAGEVGGGTSRRQRTKGLHPQSRVPSRPREKPSRRLRWRANSFRRCTRWR